MKQFVLVALCKSCGWLVVFLVIGITIKGPMLSSDLIALMAFFAFYVGVTFTLGDHIAKESK